MPDFILASAMDALAAGFGIAVAVVIAGILLLRWYRIRQEFVVMKLALEKGVTAVGPTQPQWLISLRQGMLILTLGVGLIVIGAIGWRLAAAVEQPPAGSPALAPTSMETEVAPPPTAPEPPPPGPPGPPGRGPRPRPPRPPEPPPHDPAFEAWMRARDQTTICMSLVGGGIILVLLGLVRITFVPAERKYAGHWPPSGLPPASSGV